MTERTNIIPPRPKHRPSNVSEEVHASINRALAEPTKRVTFDVPASLHRRVRVQCAEQGIHLSDVVRDFLERTFLDQR